LKSGSLNLLEPSGPVQVCNGIALPLPFIQQGIPLCMVLGFRSRVNEIFTLLGCYAV
jgi:hypothetical protein